jgi:hypothetical protein
VKQANKQGFSSWAKYYDENADARVTAQGHGYPRVLRHWNTDTKTGGLIHGAPELVIFDNEVSYLQETNSANEGVIDPNDTLPRPLSY